MKTSLLFLLLLLSFARVGAQSNHYLFKVDNLPYTELTGDIPLNQMIFAVGDPFEVTDLAGETFNLFNRPWNLNTTTTGILIFPNAFIEVVDDTSFIICDGLLRYLDSIDNTSRISYKIDGASGKKVLKVQWKNVRLRSGASDNYVNLQIWLHQETGIIEYRYGPASAGNASGFTQATGPSVGISFSDFTFSKVFEKIWIYKTPPNIAVDSVRNASFPNIWGVPVNGTAYRFVPKAVASSVADKTGNTIMNIYPNPANGKIHYTSPTSLREELKVTLVDLSGKVVYTNVLPVGSASGYIDVGSVAPGQYFIQFENETIKEQQKITLN